MIRYTGFFVILVIIISCTSIDKPKLVTFLEPETPSFEKSIDKAAYLPEIPVISQPENKIPVSEKPSAVIWRDAAPKKNKYFYKNVPLPEIPAALHLPVSAAPRVSLPAPKQSAAVVQAHPAAVLLLPDKDVTVYNRDKIVLPLPGTGWIFMGSVPSEGIVFEDKITPRTNDVFYFTAQSYGEFVLTFEKQRISVSKNEKQRILLHLKEKKDTGVLEPAAASKHEVIPVEKTLEELVKSGEYQKALLSYKRHDVLMGILKEGVNSGKLSALIFFYNKIFEDTGENIDFNDEKFLELSIDAAKILIKQGLVKQGAQLIERCLSFNNGKSGNDALLFILGTVYQNESSVRDEKKAVYYYRKLLDEYPASIYWDTAQKEYMFLKRRYIDVR